MSPEEGSQFLSKSVSERQPLLTQVSEPKVAVVHAKVSLTQ